MRRSPRCKHTWLQGREVISASVESSRGAGQLRRGIIVRSCLPNCEVRSENATRSATTQRLR
eukprot:scaffold1972_cov60-Phaeocystis_antarctica.AAC.2